MTATTTTNIRRNHERRADTAEDLIRDAQRILYAAGVHRSASWVARTVRQYITHVSGKGFPFGAYLVNRVQLNAEQRHAIRSRPDLAYVLDYADPTGETAVRNVMKERP